MSLISGKYKFEKNENMEQMMTELGVPQEFIALASQPDFTVEVSEEGNTQTFKPCMGGAITYVPNEEFDEPMFKGVKSIATRQGDVITVSSRLSDGRSASRVYNFSKDGLIVVLTLGDLTAKRYLKRI